MIKFENTEVVGWEAAIRGMRNPKNSWDKSDSYIQCREYNKLSDDKNKTYLIDEYSVGSNDHELMMKLVKGGPVHAKFRRMIAVYVDITAPLYWWKEFDTYKVGTVANSCSTMHKIHEKEFTLDDFSHEHLISRDEGWDDFTCSMENGEVVLHNCSPTDALQLICNMLNFYCNLYLKESHPDDVKTDWWQMIQLLPSSYNQKRTVMLNYEVLAGIYCERRNHKLDEWSEGFCDWIKTLPYSELITGDNESTVNTKNITPLDCNSLNAIAGLSPADVKIGRDMASREEEIYIEDILIRADVMWYSDMINGSRVVKSRNAKEPLTEQEQECLKRMWRSQGFRGDIIFYVEEAK